MPTLEDAIILATMAHVGQVDKANKPYILHPLKVMQKMETMDEMMAAVLHDVVEDTDITIDDLIKRGYPDTVVEAVRLLTHESEVEYFEYVERCKSNPIAKKVKLADTTDNMDLTRIANPQEKDYKRLEKYSRVIEILKN